MKGKRNILKTLGLTLLSACVLGGSIATAGGNKSVEKEITASAYESISNSTPDFFKTTNIEDDNAFVSYLSGEYASLSFDLEETNETVTEDGSFIGTYKTDSGYLAFDITGVSTKLNGKDISGIDYSKIYKSYYEKYKRNTSTTLNAGTNYYTYNESDGTYTKVETPVTADALTYFVEITESEKTPSYGLDFFPENFELNLSVDLDAETNSITDNNLVLKEQGLVEIEISYNQYQLSTKRIDSSISLETDTILSNQRFTYKFFLLDRDSYLEIGTDDSPSVMFDNHNIIRTSSGTPTYKYNYFFNYSSNNVSSITIDSTCYEVTVVKVGANNANTTRTLKRNFIDETIEIYDENNTLVSDTPFGIKLDGDDMSINLYDLGEYILQYKPVSYSNSILYELDKDISSQRFYVFGAQAFYTIKSGEYGELKKFDETHSSFTNPADVTYLFKDADYKIEGYNLDTLLQNGKYDLIFDNINTATTDQTPVKFSAVEGINFDAGSKIYYNNGIETDWTESNFSVLNYFSSPGKYIVKLVYNYESFTNASGSTNLAQTFNQYFSFEITKATPTTAINVFNVENANFFAVATGIITNPRDEKLFELVTGKYVASTDTTKVDGKTYYKKADNLYEFDETKGYVLTEDETPVSTKSYFTKSKIRDEDYTNDAVFFTFDNYNNIYNKTVTFELIRYDFNSKTLSAPETIDWFISGSLYEVLADGTLKITQDGNYTINVYQQGMKNPIVRKFNIDTDSNFNLNTYSVDKSSSTLNTYVQSAVDVITNQSVVFSWDNVKASGAKTEGHYKYYPISQTSLFTDDFINNQLKNYVRKDTLPVDYSLNLSASADWTPYTNFNYNENAGEIVSSQYIKSSAGLYIFQTFDSAGNYQTKVVIVDTTEPIFILYNTKEATYEILTQNDTVTEDCKVIWGKYKVIKIPKNAESKHELELEDSNLYVNRFGNYDPQIFNAVNALVCGKELTSTNDKANFSFLSLPNKNSEQSSYYLCVDIEDTVYFKNYNVGDNGYTTLSGKDFDYEYEIVSSYKLYQHNDEKLYRTTTQSEINYISIENKDEMITEINSSNLKEVDIYVYNSSNYIISYEKNGSVQYNTFDAVNNIISSSISVSESDGKLSYQGKELIKVEFVDKEGTYTFLTRDKANTKGLNIAEKNRYLSYPSAYEYLKITADQSQLRTYFIDDEGKEIELSDSSYFNSTPIIENEGTDDEIKTTQKTVYFSPTNEDVLYVSFIPTITSGGTKIQIDTVTIDYYEFVTQRYDYMINAGETNNELEGNLTVYNYYKSLKKVWTNPVTIYSYDENGEYEDIDENGIRSPFVYELNVNENKTKAGMYVVTRTYLTNATKDAGNHNEYIVTAFDYEQRTLSSYIDRYSTITQSETIAPEMSKLQFTVSYLQNKSQPNEATVASYYINFYMLADENSTEYKKLYAEISDENKLVAKNTAGNVLVSYEGTYYERTPDGKILKMEYESSTTKKTEVKKEDIINGCRGEDIINGCTEVDFSNAFSVEFNNEIINLSNISLSDRTFVSESNQKYYALDLADGQIKTKTETKDVQYLTGISVSDPNNDVRILYTNQTFSSTSTQSLVGNSIFTSMYATYSSDKNILSISHPGQSQTEMMLYNSSDSFYTRENTTNVTNLTNLFNTNKLPLRISIPKYKYTTYFVKNIITDDDKTQIANYVYETDILSYFDSENKTGSIASYELDVTVEYYANEIVDNMSPDKVYKSNGSISSVGEGYLALYDYNTKTGVFGTNEISQFTEAGNYVVKITQAPNEVEASSYNFKSTYAFRFTIEKNKPEYNLYSGTILKSIKDTNFYENSEELPYQENYYTNKTEISAVWTDSSSPYTANADKENIFVSTYLGNYKLKLSQPETGENGSVECYYYEPTYGMYIHFEELEKYFTYTYNSTTLTNTLSFNMKNLGLSNYGSSISITMQLEGHDPQYYETTQKTIIYDNRASNEIASSLVNFINNNEYGLNESDVREYYSVDGVTKTDVQNASYNQTISTGYYSKYAFVVAHSFFEELQIYLKTKFDNHIYSDTTSIYLKYISDYKNYIPTSNTYDFVENEFDEITSTTSFEDYGLGYYEIVEKDLAGNITVYLINVSAPNQTYLDENGDDVFNGLKYSIDGETEVVGDKFIETDRYVLNSGTDLKIDKLNYLGDEWNYFYTSIYNTQLGEYLNSYYLLTPDVEDGYVYKITGVATKTYTKVPLANIFSSSGQTYKSYIYVLNKLTGTYNKVSFSLLDTPSLTIVTGESGTNESKYAYLSIILSEFALSNENSIQVLPVSIKITDMSQDTNVVIFDKDNDPNSEENITNASYSYLNNWVSMSNSSVTVTSSGNVLTFTIPNVINDTKLSFSVKDNFGNEKNEIYLVGETKVTEITSNGNLYSYYGSYQNTLQETYISSTEIDVNYHTSKYSVEITPINIITTGTGLTEIALNTVINIDSLNEANKNNLPFYIVKSKVGSVETYTIKTIQKQYDITLKVDYIDIEAEENTIVKTYYIRLYNVLPLYTDDTTTPNDYYITLTNSNGGDDTNDLLKKRNDTLDEEFFTLNGKTYKVYSSTQTFSDELKVAYSSASELDFPYEVLYYSTNENWENGQDFVPLDSGSVLNQNGIYYILVRYSKVLTKEYYLFKIEILGSSGDFYYVLANGVVKSKAGTNYNFNGAEYSHYYIVNINYQDRAIKDKFEIKTNDYQNVLCFETSDSKFEGNGIYTYKYLITNYLTNDDKVPTKADEANKAPTKVGISPCRIEVFVTFLTPSSDILSITNGTTSNISYKTNDTSDKYVLSSTSQVEMIVYTDTPDTNSMTISWFKYYGIESNKINVTATKDGNKINISPKENGNYLYITLDRSGSYTFRFEDIAGNVQTFYSGQKSLPIVFIKDVHFTMSYTNSDEEEIETEAINKAVYNNKVTLKINKLLVPYYLESQFGNGNIITATKNGKEYKDFEYSNEDYSFTFSETGFYRVYMTAYGKSANTEIRKQEYTFTIVNAKESRYAYEFSAYKNYYIQSVVKNDIDITDKLVKSLKTDTNITKVSGKEYLKNLLLSYYDEKTGAGRYVITICANDSLYTTENHDMSTFSFEVYINSQQVPIIVSEEDGATTDKSVTVSFNAKNVYSAVGECYIVVGRDTYYIDETTEENVELILGDNESSGTYFIQVCSMSGNLLFSHKINLQEPMNAWTIIAIIAGVVAIVLVAFIVIKLRKRMGVK